jgi:hypothetical protein
MADHTRTQTEPIMEAPETSTPRAETSPEGSSAVQRRVLRPATADGEDVRLTLVYLHSRLQGEPMDHCARLCMIDSIEKLMPELEPMSDDYRQRLYEAGGV